MKKSVYSFVAAAVFLVSCGSAVPLNTVASVDLKKYSGTWYEIARITHSFEKDLVCVTATYVILPDGRVSVLNQGRVKGPEGALKKAVGTAWVPDPANPGRLKVRFFWPFAGNYYIFDLDPHYKHVLIGDPSRDYLWILSRKPIMDLKQYRRLIEIAKKNGFNTERLERVDQKCKK